MAKRSKKVFLNLDSNEFVLKKDILKVFNLIKKESVKTKNLKFVLTVPEHLLLFLKEKYAGKKISFGSRNMFRDEKGQVSKMSLETLADFKIDYCFVYDNTKSDVYKNLQISPNKKLKKVLKTKVKPILVVGESSRDSTGKFADVLESQIKEVLQNIETKHLSNITLIYKPTWVGKKNRTIPNEVLSQSLYLIKKILFRMYGEDSKQIEILFYSDLEDKNVLQNLDDFDYNGVYININNRKNNHFFELFKEEKK